jgi:acyl-CoA synthetase (AMP-forming)/AMP-acid ligase II
MRILEKLKKIWTSIDYPFLVHPNGKISFSEVSEQKIIDLHDIKSGDVVALIGDFDPISILTLIRIIDKNVILVPLTKETKSQHNYFFETALVDVIIENNSLKRLKNDKKNALIELLRKKKHAGLILFSTGTTGRPKAILHDLTLFMKRFDTPRPRLKTMSFLLFDHIGGLNTLMHTLFNKGTIISPKSRNVEDVLAACDKHQIEVLPTTPTFLRMMLLSGLIPKNIPKSLRIITYGTERMDQTTLDSLCELLPNIDFRQTFGMSELGILRVKSKARNSLFMKVGGEDIETRVINNVLEIRSKTRMMGYLNADSPFDNDGWYNTKDVVEEKDGYYKVIGRTSEVINVGGLKFMASELERVALQFQGVELAKAEGKLNPITGQHVELLLQSKKNFLINQSKLKKFLKNNLPRHMIPMRIKISNIKISHRLKKI